MQLQERAEVQEDAIATLRQELQRVLVEVRGLRQAHMTYQCLRVVWGLTSAWPPQRDDLRKERAVLVHNISSLFRTAQEELERKDAEIKDLRARVAVQPLPPPPRLPPGSS